MNVIERAKKIILNPKEEWAVIETESTDVAVLITGYLLPLALIPTVAGFIGCSFIGVAGYTSLSWGFKFAISLLIQMVIGTLVAAWVINALSTSFASRSDFNKALQLAVYSFTPMMVAGVLYIVPGLGKLATLAGIYGLYILYLGMKPMMQTPEDKITAYFVVNILVMMGVYLILGAILAAGFIGRAL